MAETVGEWGDRVRLSPQITSTLFLLYFPLSLHERHEDAVAAFDGYAQIG